MFFFIKTQNNTYALCRIYKNKKQFLLKIVYGEGDVSSKFHPRYVYFHPADSGMVVHAA